MQARGLTVLCRRSLATGNAWGAGMARYRISDWLIPAGLLVLAFIPVVAGIARLVTPASLPQHARS
jgi:hypothetical protein